MHRSYFLLLVFLSSCLMSCNTEDASPAAEATIVFAKPYFLVDEVVQMEVETSNVRRMDWDFGNGQTSSSTNPGAIMYHKPGIYPITLTMTSYGGEKTIKTEKVTIGQYHAFEAVLHRAEGWQEGSSADVKLKVRRYNSDPEPFWESAVVEEVKFENLPVTFPLEDIPLGGNGKGFYSYPLFRFINVQTGEVLAMAGASTAYEYPEGEIFISSIGRHSLRYKVILPEG
jgi:PKD repeat protein